MSCTRESNRQSWSTATNLSVEAQRTTSILTTFLSLKMKRNRIPLIEGLFSLDVAVGSLILLPVPRTMSLILSGPCPGTCFFCTLFERRRTVLEILGSILGQDSEDARVDPESPDALPSQYLALLTVVVAGERRNDVDGGIRVDDFVVGLMVKVSGYVNPAKLSNHLSALVRGTYISRCSSTPNKVQNGGRRKTRPRVWEK